MDERKYLRGLADMVDTALIIRLDNAEDWVECASTPSGATEAKVLGKALCAEIVERLHRLADLME